MKCFFHSAAGYIVIANENISHFSENNTLIALTTPDYFTQRETASSKQKFESISVNKKLFGIFCFRFTEREYK